MNQTSGKTDEFLGKKQQQDAPVRGSVDVLPWRVPPMGSAGDPWDQFISLPEEKLAEQQKHLEEEQDKKRRKKGRKRVHGEVLFRDLIPDLHLAFIIGVMFTAMALGSLGPVYPLMPFLALAGMMSAITGLTLINTVQKDKAGYGVGVGVIVTCLAIITVTELNIRSQTYETFTRDNLAAPREIYNDQEKLEVVQQNMELLARAVECAISYSSPDEVLDVGRNSRNRNVRQDSVSFRISTIKADPGDRSELAREFTWIHDSILPSDFFSDDTDATFGVSVAAGHIFIYSPGPDGTWQINPREPFDGEPDGVQAFLEQYLYNPQSGGDLIYVLPISEDLAFRNPYECSTIREQCEDAWSI